MSHTAYNQATGTMMDTTGIQVETLDFDEVISIETISDGRKATGSLYRLLAVTSTSARKRPLVSMHHVTSLISYIRHMTLLG